MTENLWKLSATKTARQIKESNISCEAVMMSHLERLNQTRSLNAVTTHYDDDTTKVARKEDTILKTSNDIGPLHGVPITIKENTDQLSRATSHGVLGFKGRFSGDDSPLVISLLSAGIITLGCTNSPEFAWRFHTVN